VKRKNVLNVASFLVMLADPRWQAIITFSAYLAIGNIALQAAKTVNVIVRLTTTENSYV
jgi:hypothetical protein